VLGLSVERARFDSLYLTRKLEDLAQLPRECLGFVGTELEPCERSEAPHVVSGEGGHGRQDSTMPVRPSAVAGTWYPGISGALAREVDAYLDAAGDPPTGEIGAIFAPHAGLMFSGPVGAYAYKAAALASVRAQTGVKPAASDPGRPYDVAFVVGPSHFFGFDGVAVWPDGAFESPLGPAAVDADAAADLLRHPVAHATLEPHRREHSIEMQLPFLRRLLPQVPIVPALMGQQRHDTIVALAEALASAARGRRALLVASTDLSHYFDARTAATLDAGVQACVNNNDADALMALFERYPEHERGRYVACGGGPAIAVMQAANLLGAREGKVLKYAHSGEVSGDYDGVVGYLAAAFGRFDADARSGAPLDRARGAPERSQTGREAAD
jgi:AmmeMemoRadiSam system protein B